ncbi:BAG family molecular chaperone regulator 7-like [Mangifera indica]|uniref:BAG family molecular chaperone regulator 7-like n=1 Tax=Mangifera indica TaxID=29780 RepID=UPI001CFABAEC|nr:BAG family molecular chaperone regulator 7-like [Mangifera indica]
MRRFSRIEFVEPYHPPPLFVRETSIFAPTPLSFPSFFEEEHDLSFALDLLTPKPSLFEVFDTVTDLIQIEKTPSLYSCRRVQKRFSPKFALETLCDRVSALESRFDWLVNERVYGGDRKYTWTAEIQGGPIDRSYKWTADIKGGKKKEKEDKKKIDKSYKWTAKIKGKGEDGPTERTFTFEASTGNAGDCSKSDKKEKKKDKKKGDNETRVVEIEEPGDHGALVLRQAFSKRPGAVRSSRGKLKELSPQDAAIMIQMTFRAYLIQRSQALRALRDLAVAKTKLKEVRALFNNFSYRRQVARDAEEQQRFSEKIIVLLLTVDAIEGADRMVRAAKRSMVDELEAMLDVVDPQPAGRSLSVRRRTFDMPDGVIQKEIAAGVAQVVQMIDEEKGAGTFEACI